MTNIKQLFHQVKEAVNSKDFLGAYKLIEHFLERHGIYVMAGMKIGLVVNKPETIIMILVSIDGIKHKVTITRKSLFINIYGYPICIGEGRAEYEHY